MSVAAMASRPWQVPVGGHVFWAVDNDESYVAGVESLLGLAHQRHEKALVFGPEGSTPLAGLDRRPAGWVDPGKEFLGRGPLVPGLMLSAFGELVDCSHHEGYAGLLVVADMDWLLPAKPTTDDVISFEVLLDRGINELGATVVCAYRTASFDADVLAGVPCVHPIDTAGHDPSFRLVANGTSGWRLSGEVDIAVAGYVEPAIRAAIGDGDADIDVADLAFLDACGMRAIVHAAAGRGVRLLGPRPIIRRCWEAAGFADDAPLVQLVD